MVYRTAASLLIAVVAVKFMMETLGKQIRNSYKTANGTETPYFIEALRFITSCSVFAKRGHKMIVNNFPDSVQIL
jgi:hypothetical protein